MTNIAKWTNCQATNKSICIVMLPVSNPPYNIKWQPPLPLENDIRFPAIPPAGNANYAFVFNCIARANKAVLILPMGALTQRNEYDIRKYLIDNDLIESIITLPNNMVWNVQVYQPA